MRLLDRVRLNQKLAEVAQKRNALLEMHRGSIHPLFSLMPLYLGLFWQGIYEDENTCEILHIAATSETVQLDVADQLLVFWFFWSTQKMLPGLLIETAVLQGLRNVWSINDELLLDLVRNLMAKPIGEDVLFLWKTIGAALGDASLRPTFTLIHIRNAQHAVLVDLPEFMGRNIKSS